MRSPWPEEIERLGRFLGQADDATGESGHLVICVSWSGATGRGERRRRRNRHARRPRPTRSESGARTSARRRRTSGTRRARRRDRSMAGNSSRSAASNSRPANCRSSTFGLTHVNRARSPPATIVRASAVGVRAEEREDRRQPRAGQPLLAIAPDVFEEQVAERDVREAFADGLLHGRRHGPLVDLVRARRRNRNLPERQPQRIGLRPQQLDPHRVHRHPLMDFVHRRQHPGQLDVRLLAKDVHHPGGVLAGGPRHHALDHLACTSGCSTCARRRAASTMRGPGTTNWSPTRTWIRLAFTAGTEPSASHARRSRAGRVLRALAVAQLDDHVRPPRQDHLGAGLDGLLLEVAEDVVAAGDVEQVGEKAVAAAGVDVLQRRPVAFEHQHRPRPAPSRPPPSARRPSACSMRRRQRRWPVRRSRCARRATEWSP